MYEVNINKLPNPFMMIKLLPAHRTSVQVKNMILAPYAKLTWPDITQQNQSKSTAK